MINIETFKERFSYFDKEVVVEIIDIFIEEYDDRIKNITQYIEDQNLDEFRKAIHAFKGVMSNFEEKCLAYQKIYLIHHEAAVLFDQIKEGRLLSDAELDSFSNSMKKEFAVFKPASYKMLNDLKVIRPNYL